MWCVGDGDGADDRGDEEAQAHNGMAGDEIIYWKRVMMK